METGSISALTISPDLDPSGACLNAAISDFLDALHAFNLELNGPVPSEVLVTGEEDSIPRGTAYAVSEVLRMLATPAPHYAKTVALAWNLVLAGDIDDLRAELSFNP